MKVVILEDEKLAVERLRLLLTQIDPRIELVAALESVEQGICFFRQPVLNANLVLMDIHLADGSAFDLFRHVDVPIPVIFTTAYDQYAIDAFKVLSIDYLLKPITLEALTRSLDKMRRFRLDPALPKPNYYAIGNHGPLQRSSYKSRFLGRTGQKWVFINTQEIALVSVDNRIVRITTMDKVHYLVDHTLETMEQELDPGHFFRINRSIIVHAAAIGQVKPFINHRLRLVLKTPLESEDIVVSRDRVPDFKKWAES